MKTSGNNGQTEQSSLEQGLKKKWINDSLIKFSGGKCQSLTKAIICFEWHWIFDDFPNND